MRIMNILEWTIIFSFFKSKLCQLYFFFDIRNLFLEPLVFLNGFFVLLLQFGGIDICGPAKKFPYILDSSVRPFILLVELHEDFGDLVHGTSFLQIVLELGFLRLDSLTQRRSTSDMCPVYILYIIVFKIITFVNWNPKILISVQSEGHLNWLHVHAQCQDTENIYKI